MEPITKQEVQEARTQRLEPGLVTLEAKDAIYNEGWNLQKHAWLLIGYKIACRRVEKGEEL